MTDVGGAEARKRYRDQARDRAGKPARYRQPRAAEVVPSWLQRAACKGRPTSWWFASPGSSNPDEREDAAVAAQICAGCPVKVECSQDAREHGEYGKWGFWERYQEKSAERKAEYRAAQRGEPSKLGFVCSECGRGCASEHGLKSHIKQKHRDDLERAVVSFEELVAVASHEVFDALVRSR